MAGVLMTLEMCSTLILSKMKPVLLEVLGIHGLFTMFAGKIVFFRDGLNSLLLQVLCWL